MYLTNIPPWGILPYRKPRPKAQIFTRSNDHVPNSRYYQGCCRTKQTPREEGQRRQLQNRLNRMIGQLGGISRMLEENRYCGDILTQVAAVESALQSFGYIVLQEHMETCVAQEVRKGNDQILEEAVELMKKLK